MNRLYMVICRSNSMRTTRMMTTLCHLLVETDSLLIFFAVFCDLNYLIAQIIHREPVVKYANSRQLFNTHRKSKMSPRIFDALSVFFRRAPYTPFLLIKGIVYDLIGGLTPTYKLSECDINEARINPSTGSTSCSA